MSTYSSSLLNSLGIVPVSATTPISGKLNFNKVSEIQRSGQNIEPSPIVTISTSTDEFFLRNIQCSLVYLNGQAVKNGISSSSSPKYLEKAIELGFKLNVQPNNQVKYRLKFELSGENPIYTNEFTVEKFSPSQREEERH